MSESEDSAASTITSPQCSPLSSIASTPASSPTVELLKSPIKKDVIVNRPTRPTLVHPSTAVMVTAAIKSLKDKKGSTLPAIKKYMAINYQVDSAKFAPYIRRYLKSAVAKGELIQTNGTGATGNFKLPAADKKPVVNKKASDSEIVKKKPASKKPIAKKALTVTSGKRRSIEGATTTITTVSNAKKPKKVVTAVGKPKTNKKTVAAKASPAKKNNSKLSAKKAPTKTEAPKKKIKRKKINIK